MSEVADNITHWLHKWHAGDPNAADELFRLLMPDLKKIAARLRRREHDCSLQPTEMINEIFGGLAKANKEIDWRDRGHLFAIFTIKLGRYLIDRARIKKLKLLPIDELPEGAVARRNGLEELLNVDRLLDELEKENSITCAVLVASSYFGYENREIAEKLGLSLRTVERHLHEGRKWLYGRLRKK